MDKDYKISLIFADILFQLLQGTATLNTAKPVGGITGDSMNTYDSVGFILNLLICVQASVRKSVASTSSDELTCWTRKSVAMR
jgi:hypothetical protein